MKRLGFEFRNDPEHLYLDKIGTFTERQLQLIQVAIGYELELAKAIAAKEKEDAAP